MNSAKKAALVLAATGLTLTAAAGSAFAAGGAQADGRAMVSPGIGSGNLAQVPVHVPVNATGNSANVIGALNPTFDNESSNS
ncbi:chaplin [Streptomyces sp. NPDC048196]|uniref:chaplin n=1 Tax=Streptomyces sp. NPDC048196 TaxID=3154712 RepID=UPI0033E7A074